MLPGECESRKQHCRKFINREDIGRPFIGSMWEPCILPVQTYVKRIGTANTARAADIDADEMCQECDIVIALSDQINQDFFYAVQASFNHLWLSASLGCAIKVTTATIWSEKPDVTLTQIANWDLDIHDEWIEKLIECHKRIIAHCAGRAAVAIPWLDGPLDLLVSLLGAEQTAYALIDDPEMFHKAMDKLTDYVIGATRRLADLTPQFAEGYVSRMHLYTLEPCPTVMDDATWMTSGSVFRQNIWPYEARMCAVFPGSVYHMHNTSSQITDTLGDSSLQIIQYTVDPNGPSWAVQKKAIAGLQQKKPVVLSFWNMNDMERARTELDPQGLALTLVLNTMPDRTPDPELLDDFQKWYSRMSGQ